MKTVLVTVDAVRADHLATFGYDRDTMPAVESFAAEATTFTAAFANGTNTGISLPSLLASRYRGDRYVEGGPNVASVLGDAGVTTAGFHSNALFANRVDGVTGFDDFEDFDVASSDADDDGAVQRIYDRVVDALRPVTEQFGVRAYAERVQEAIFPTEMIHEFTVYVDAESVTDAVSSWLDDHADEEFFLWVHYMDPHRPYGIDLEDPAFLESVPDEEERKRLASKAGIHPEAVTEEERRQLVDLYDSDLRYTSDHVERLFDHLRELGVWDGTDVIVTADHGEEFGDHGYYYHRNRPYDELVHVPLFAKFAGDDAAPDVVDGQRELLDLAPTICRRHGVEPPGSFRGERLLDGDPRRVVARGSFNDSGPVVAARWDGWKYVSADDGEELYDLASDPGEYDDVAGEHPDRLESFRSAIPDSLREADATERPEADSETVEHRLEQLGYLE